MDKLPPREQIKIVRFLQSAILLMLWGEFSHLTGRAFTILFPSKPDLLSLQIYLGAYEVAIALAIIGIAGAIQYKLEKRSKFALVFERLPRPVFDGK